MEKTRREKTTRRDVIVAGLSVLAIFLALYVGSYFAVNRVGPISVETANLFFSASVQVDAILIVAAAVVAKEVLSTVEMRGFRVTLLGLMAGAVSLLALGMIESALDILTASSLSPGNQLEEIRFTFSIWVMAVGLLLAGILVAGLSRTATGKTES